MDERSQLENNECDTDSRENEEDDYKEVSSR